MSYPVAAFGAVAEKSLDTSEIADQYSTEIIQHLLIIP